MFSIKITPPALAHFNRYVVHSVDLDGDLILVVLVYKCSGGFCSWRRWMGGQGAIIVGRSSIVSCRPRGDRILRVTGWFQRLERQIDRRHQQRSKNQPQSWGVPPFRGIQEERSDPSQLFVCRAVIDFTIKKAAGYSAWFTTDSDNIVKS